MSALPVLLLLVVGTLTAVMVVPLVLLVVLRRRPAPAPSQTAEAARRHALVVHVAAWVVGFAAGPLLVTLPIGWAVSAAGSGPYGGIGAAVYPAVLGLLFLAVHAVGEVTWPRPTGAVRRAALLRRTVADVTPPLLRRVLWSWAGVLVVTLVVCGLLADGGRQVSRTFPDGGASAGPFPGWFFGVPLLIALTAVLAATYGVLRLVAGRPAVVDTAPAWDLSLRRLSAHRVLRGAQLVVGLTAGAVLAVAGMALQNLGHGNGDAARESALLTAGGVALTLTGGAVVIAALVLAALPAPPVVTDGVEPHVGPGDAGRPPAPAAPTPSAPGPFAPAPATPGQPGDRPSASELQAR
jgi:hypothetical protein